MYHKLSLKNYIKKNKVRNGKPQPDKSLNIGETVALQAYILFIMLDIGTCVCHAWIPMLNVASMYDITMVDFTQSVVLGEEELACI